MSAGSGVARPHHKRRTRTVPMEAEDREGTFAPPRPPYICKSRAGRMRQAHVGDADSRCIYCSRYLGQDGADLKKALLGMRRIKGVEA